jgi:hypothetical protein
VFDPINDINPMLLELFNFVWVIGHEPDAINAHVGEYVCRNGVVTTISRQVECKVCVECVEPTVLEIVGLHFGKQSDAAAFLTEIQNDSTSFFLDGL